MKCWRETCKRGCFFSCKSVFHIVLCSYLIQENLTLFHCVNQVRGGKELRYMSSGRTSYKPIIKLKNIKAVLCIFHLSDFKNRFRLNLVSTVWQKRSIRAELLEKIFRAIVRWLWKKPFLSNRFWTKYLIADCSWDATTAHMPESNSVFSVRYNSLNAVFMNRVL